VTSIIVVGIVLVAAYVIHRIRRNALTGQCENARCGEPVRLTIKSAAPSGPNPLRISWTVVTYRCAACGAKGHYYRA
jgi:hypothetical protein